MVGHRVVVTGLGCISPYGKGVAALWEGLMSIQGGLKWNEQLNHVVGQVSEEVIAEISPSEKREKGRVVLWSEIAAAEAMRDARAEGMDHTETLVNVGTGVVDLELIGETSEMVRSGKGRRTSPFFTPRILNNMPAGYVAMKYGIRGGAECMSTACATGVHSIGSAFHRIRYGSVRRAIVGSTEAAVTPLGIHAFERMRALARGKKAVSCPFDEKRAGFVMSEGSAFLFLEREEDARKRGVKIYAEMRGFGISSDVTHITSPPPDGSGLRMAMERAMRDGGVEREQIGYVNAHATSTRNGDEAEAAAIEGLLGEGVAVSSNKGHLGHLLAGAGSIETLTTVLSLERGNLPQTLNLEKSDCAKIRHVQKGEIIERSDACALVNSSGFGGTNAVVLLQKYRP
ncbi:hypothetical protein PMAYCL1PPCAC_23509 [Pristionchus mayeri]|uniref:beta-ketoacyl-[acyl-carrier-protein] synthase I n=1 Tax=Pristionchus mayeri TaxID=1317129 RepID=A0AAN5CZ27_9BILA|nr:hypothetical protein PMAYCL1PPCAC_23509 [Pristionchus mayeri]